VSARIESLPGLRKSHPQNEDELECVVEGCRAIREPSSKEAQVKLTEPVNSTHGTLKYSQEGIGYPILWRC
jgi:hypothetical protein